MKINKIGGLQVILSSACFGTLPLLTMLSYSGGANVVTILAFRFCIASLIIWPYLWWTKTKIIVTLKQLGIFVIMAIFGYGVMAVTYFTSLYYIPSSMAAMIMFVYPVVVTYLSAVLLKSPITRAKIVALGLVSVGAISMTWGGKLAFHPVGVLLALISALFYALYIVYLGSPYTFNQEPKVLTAFIILFSAIFFTALGLIQGSLIFELGAIAWEAIIVMAIISTVFAIMAFYSGVQKIGPSLAAIISTVEPVTALILGMVIFAERLSYQQWFGVLLIILGVVYVQMPETKSRVDWKARI